MHSAKEYYTCVQMCTHQVCGWLTPTVQVSKTYYTKMSPKVGEEILGRRGEEDGGGGGERRGGRKNIEPLANSLYLQYLILKIDACMSSNQYLDYINMTILRGKMECSFSFLYSIDKVNDIVN